MELCRKKKKYNTPLKPVIGDTWCVENVLKHGQPDDGGFIPFLLVYVLENDKLKMLDAR